ncbi:MAG: DUF5050 domain-containing protein [Oscillospiraceae bacterium]|nr:DUF5050 domain-containing protein [Oscillospiraceae bacterium]
MAYDVFISFKNSGENGQPTKDSVIAKKLYDFLSAKGLSVFFSNEALEHLGKAQYTKVIDEALDSSRFLIAVGSSHENFNSLWVRYEWESFLNDIRSGIKPSAEEFVLYNGMKINDLPRQLRQQQAFDAGDKTSFEKLYNFIKNALKAMGDSGEDTGIGPINQEESKPPKPPKVRQPLAKRTKTILTAALAVVVAGAVFGGMVLFGGDGGPVDAGSSTSGGGLQTSSDTGNNTESSTNEENPQASSDIDNTTSSGYSNAVGNTAWNLLNDGNAAIQGDWVYFNSNEMLYKTKADGSSGHTLLTDSVVKYFPGINVVGDWIYYMSSDYCIYRIKTDGTGKEKLFDENYASNIVVVGDELFYRKHGSLSYFADTPIVKLNLQTNEEKIIKGNVTQFSINGNRIIGYATYPTPEGSSKYSDCFVVDFDGNVIETWREEHWISSPAEYQGAYYFIEQHDETLDGDTTSYLIRKDGNQTTKLTTAGGYNIAGEWIFFQDNVGCFYKMKSDGTKSSYITDEYMFKYVIVGDWIYYMGSDSFYRMRTDGTDKQQLP